MVSIIEALDYIDPRDLDYNEWLHVGMALKVASKSDSSITWRIWDEWSRQDGEKYEEGVCEDKWRSFQSSGITEGTIFFRAMNNGFKIGGNKPLDWNAVIEYDGEPYLNDTETYLRLLFNEDDIVNYMFAAGENKGKYYPTGQGVSRRVGDILERLEHYDGDISNALGDYNPEAGGWIHINPLDGEGIKNQNVADYRYCLVESDEMDIDGQFRKILELKLPCAAIVNSGGKSLHAIMHVDAENAEEYKKRVNWIFTVLEDNNFPVDKNVKNPGRLTRLPGLKRGENYQSLVRGKTGLKNFYEWEDYIKYGMGEELLPDIVSFEEIVENPPPLKPELIKGVLRQSHKMLIAGASKSGKSFGLIDLMTCVAEGKPWLGLECKQGKVLYINLEIDDASFWHRIIQMYKKKGWEHMTPSNIDVWNLRGHAMPAEDMVGRIIRKARGQNYSLIVLDPIYKIQAGDENSAQAITNFTNAIDRLVNETGCCVVYCHHHSKGAQSGKRSMDRSSGSGVFARDADTIVDIIELSNESYQDIDEYKDLRSFQITTTLREFENIKPINVFFDFPRYRLDTEGILDNAKTMDEYLNSKQSRKKEEKLSKEEEFELAFDVLAVDENKVPIQELMNYMGKEERSIKYYKSKCNEKNKELGLPQYIQKTIDGTVYIVKVL